MNVFLRITISSPLCIITAVDFGLSTWLIHQDIFLSCFLCS
uniref:Uncharacterized protein n=1 Tax=Anguilla anguilla TaxID=7936 RepID=A0A0E9WGA1_ANGAN